MTGTDPVEPRRARRWGVVALLVAVLGVATISWWGRSLAFFRVHHVEVRGTRFVKPADVVRRLAIDTMTSVWSALDTLARRVERHPQVREATVRRRLPGTLVVEIEENEPVALVQGARGLRAYDQEGRALPLDPAQVLTDLPIADRADTTLLQLLADLRTVNPQAFAEVSEVRLVGKDQFRFIMGDVPVLAMRDLGVERFDELSSVRRDLAQRGLAPVELDLRYKDQVIARLP